MSNPTTCTADQHQTTETTGTVFNGSCTNDAGLISDATPLTIKVDKTKPVITASATNTDASVYTAGDWTNQSVTVSFSCDDIGAVQSGVQGAPLAIAGGGTQSTNTSNGSFTSTGTCTDGAGNTADPVTFDSIKVDKTKPVITASATNTDASVYTAGDWTNQSVTVSFSCDDIGAVQSGIATNTIAGTTVSSDTPFSGTSVTDTGSCVDRAGNSADARNFGPVRVDKTPATASHTIWSPSYTNGGHTYVTSATKLTFTTGDTLSGFKDCTITVTKPDTSTANTSSCGNGGNDYFLNGGLLGTASDGSYGNAVSVDDTAGNNQTDSFSLVLDNTAPTFGVCPAGGPFALNSGDHAVGPISASDSGSGVDTGASTLTGTVHTNTAAQQSVTFTAIDHLGNSATKTCIYDIMSLTFGQPIDVAPVMNIAKLGRVVPVKANVYVDGVLVGSTTTQPIYIGGYSPVDCSATSPTDGIDVYAAAGSSNTGNLFRWDPTSLFRIYNFDTSAFKAGNCYQISVYYGGSINGSGVASGGARAGYFLLETTK
jgi:hypothetical protein